MGDHGPEDRDDRQHDLDRRQRREHRFERAELDRRGVDPQLYQVIRLQVPADG